MYTQASLDELYAEKGELMELLSLTPTDDILGRIGIEARLKDVEEQILKLNEKNCITAETVLYFSGKPVKGSDGIDVEFASNIMGAYQNLVSSIHAAYYHKSPLCETGQIPLHDDSILQLIATPRGSFGFALKEKTDQYWLIESKLFHSVEKTNSLLSASSNLSEEEVTEILQELPPRVINELKTFWSLLDNAEATISIKSTETDVKITTDQIKDAQQRTEQIKIHEQSGIKKKGIFHGARTNSRDFNFLPDEENPIKGKLGKNIEERFITTMNTEFQSKRCIAILTLRQTQKVDGGKFFNSWTLDDIYLDDSQEQ